MRSDLKVLTVGLMLVAVGVAGCSSTTAGSSGAVQDDASVSSASAGPAPSPSASSASADASPGSASPSGLPVESETALPGAVGPILNSPTPAPANGVCDEGQTYACGDIGPGGGVVFYSSSTSFECGAGMSSTCNFLEVAPNGWNGKLVNCPGSGTGLVQTSCGGSNPQTSDYGSQGAGTGRGYGYCTGMGEKNVIADASGTAIGTGYANTTAMVGNCKNDDAGSLARNYRGGGLSDWSLPSLDEINALYVYPNRDAIGGFSSANYWSSSQASGKDASKHAYGENFYEGYQDSSNLKSYTVGVRPVRAF